MQQRIFKNLDYQKDKLLKFEVKITTRIKGDIKNKFLNDCIKKKMTEADLARNIIEIYYSATNEISSVGEKSMYEVKKYIVDKIKFK